MSYITAEDLWTRTTSGDSGIITRSYSAEPQAIKDALELVVEHTKEILDDYTGRQFDQDASNSNRGFQLPPQRVKTFAIDEFDIEVSSGGTISGTSPTFKVRASYGNELTDLTVDYDEGLLGVSDPQIMIHREEVKFPYSVIEFSTYSPSNARLIVNARWGWNPLQVPSSVKSAALFQANRIWYLRPTPNANYNDTSFSFDTVARESLKRYRRGGGFIA